jgi:hypothetical protein
MKIDTNGKDMFAGGERFSPGDDGLVEIPDSLAKAEGLLDEDESGKVDPWERIDALEAENAELKAEIADLLEKIEPASPDKAALVAQAVELGVKGPDGKPAAPTTLERWAVKRLQDAIAAAKE